MKVPLFRKIDCMRIPVAESSCRRSRFGSACVRSWRIPGALGS